jgi:hypothetical protein
MEYVETYASIAGFVLSRGGKILWVYDGAVMMMLENLFAFNGARKLVGL